MIWASFCCNGGRSDRFSVGYSESFRDCTKEHESKEAISYESRPEFHRVNVMACPEQCRRVSHAREAFHPMEGGAPRRLTNFRADERARGARASIRLSGTLRFSR